MLISKQKVKWFSITFVNDSNEGRKLGMINELERLECWVNMEVGVVWQQLFDVQRAACASWRVVCGLGRLVSRKEGERDESLL